jgi:hypothetical protein
MSLSLVEYLVFDEADRLFEMGFSQQIGELMNRVGANRQVSFSQVAKLPLTSHLDCSDVSYNASSARRLCQSWAP